MLLALMVMGGLGNSVFHPADYAILSSAIDQRRMGRAFSIHTFGGHAGFALAPPVVVSLTAIFDWRIALMLSGAAGLVVTLLMVVNSDVLRADTDGWRPSAARGDGAAGFRLLLGGPILMALLFFVMLALSLGGFMSFSVAAIEALYRVPLAEATVPLTTYLTASALGVLAGGWIADRTHHHQYVVGGCFVLIAIFSALIPELLPPLTITAGLFGLAGFFSGAVAPSRDMMVRAVTPPGASGKVFGFVTTGFNIGGIVAPLLFGFTLDHGAPGLVFWTIAALSLLTLGVVYGSARLGQPPSTALAHD
jgi:MFS family permease